MEGTAEHTSEPATLSGVVVPLVTPFRENGAVDVAVLERLCSFLVDKGVHGLFVTGTTGEFPLLTSEERAATVEICVASASGRIPVVAQVGAPSTSEAIHLAERAASAGADGIAAAAPYYFAYDEQALYAYYSQLCTAIYPLPVYLYNIPQRTGNPLSRELVLRLVGSYANIHGMKDSFADMAALLHWIELRDGAAVDFSVLIGDDALSLPFLRVGGDGIVSAVSGVFPELYVDYFASHLRGRTAELRDDYQVIRALASINFGGRIDCIKEGLAWRGFPVGRVRPPLIHGSEADMRSLRTQVERALRGSRWESLLGKAGALP